VRVELVEMLREDLVSEGDRMTAPKRLLKLLDDA